MMQQVFETGRDRDVELEVAYEEIASPRPVQLSGYLLAYDMWDRYHRMLIEFPQIASPVWLPRQHAGWRPYTQGAEYGPGTVTMPHWLVPFLDLLRATLLRRRSAEIADAAAKRQQGEADQRLRQARASAAMIRKRRRKAAAKPPPCSNGP